MLKYREGLHRYVQIEMDFIYISSLGGTYRYDVKIEQKHKQKMLQFGSMNPSQQKKEKCGPDA
jgi:hypothetical protein